MILYYINLIQKTKFISLIIYFFVILIINKFLITNKNKKMKINYKIIN